MGTSGGERPPGPHDARSSPGPARRRSAPRTARAGAARRRRASRSRETTCVASSECPPRSKKSSWTPTRLDTEHLAPDAASAPPPVRGATYRSPAAASGGGRAAAVHLAVGVSGSAARPTKAPAPCTRAALPRTQLSQLPAVVSPAPARRRPPGAGLPARLPRHHAASRSRRRRAVTASISPARCGSRAPSPDGRHGPGTPTRRRPGGAPGRPSGTGALRARRRGPARSAPPSGPDGSSRATGRRRPVQLSRHPGIGHQLAARSSTAARCCGPAARWRRSAQPSPTGGRGPHVVLGRPVAFKNRRPARRAPTARAGHGLARPGSRSSPRSAPAPRSELGEGRGGTTYRDAWHPPQRDQRRGAPGLPAGSAERRPQARVHEQLEDRHVEAQRGRTSTPRSSAAKNCSRGFDQVGHRCVLDGTRLGRPVEPEV